MVSDLAFLGVHSSFSSLGTEPTRVWERSTEILEPLGLHMKREQTGPALPFLHLPEG